MNNNNDDFDFLAWISTLSEQQQDAVLANDPLAPRYQPGQASGTAQGAPAPGPPPQLAQDPPPLPPRRNKPLPPRPPLGVNDFLNAATAEGARKNRLRVKHDQAANGSVIRPLGYQQHNRAISFLQNLGKVDRLNFFHKRKQTDLNTQTQLLTAIANKHSAVRANETAQLFGLVDARAGAPAGRVRPLTSDRVRRIGAFLEQSVAATTISKTFKAYRARAELQRLKRQKAAKKLLPVLRAYALRQVFLRKRNAATEISKTYRGHKKRAEYLKIRKAATNLQAHIKGSLARQRTQRFVRAVTDLQAHARGALFRQRHQKEKAATKIQAAFKGYRQRKNLTVKVNSYKLYNTAQTITSATQTPVQVRDAITHTTIVGLAAGLVDIGIRNVTDVVKDGVTTKKTYRYTTLPHHYFKGDIKGGDKFYNPVEEGSFMEALADEGRLRPNKMTAYITGVYRNALNQTAPELEDYATIGPIETRGKPVISAPIPPEYGRDYVTFHFPATGALAACAPLLSDNGVATFTADKLLDPKYQFSEEKNIPGNLVHANHGNPRAFVVLPKHTEGVPIPLDAKIRLGIVLTQGRGQISNGLKLDETSETGNRLAQLEPNHPSFSVNLDGGEVVKAGLVDHTAKHVLKIAQSSFSDASTLVVFSETESNAARPGYRFEKTADMQIVDSHNDGFQNQQRPLTFVERQEACRLAGTLSSRLGKQYPKKTDFIQKNDASMQAVKQQLVQSTKDQRPAREYMLEQLALHAPRIVAIANDPPSELRLLEPIAWYLNPTPATVTAGHLPAFVSAPTFTAGELIADKAAAEIVMELLKVNWSQDAMTTLSPIVTNVLNRIQTTDTALYNQLKGDWEAKEQLYQVLATKVVEQWDRRDRPGTPQFRIRRPEDFPDTEDGFTGKLWHVTNDGQRAYFKLYDAQKQVTYLIEMSPPKLGNTAALTLNQKYQIEIDPSDVANIRAGEHTQKHSVAQSHEKFLERTQRGLKEISKQLAEYERDQRPAREYLLLQVATQSPRTVAAARNLSIEAGLLDLMKPYLDPKANDKTKSEIPLPAFAATGDFQPQELIADETAATLLTHLLAIDWRPATMEKLIPIANCVLDRIKTTMPECHAQLKEDLDTRRHTYEKLCEKSEKKYGSKDFVIQKPEDNVGAKDNFVGTLWNMTDKHAYFALDIGQKKAATVIVVPCKQLPKLGNNDVDKKCRVTLVPGDKAILTRSEGNSPPPSPSFGKATFIK